MPDGHRAGAGRAVAPWMGLLYDVEAEWLPRTLSASRKLVRKQRDFLLRFERSYRPQHNASAKQTVFCLRIEDPFHWEFLRGLLCSFCMKHLYSLASCMVLIPRPMEQPCVLYLNRWCWYTDVERQLSYDFLSLGQEIEISSLPVLLHKVG